MTDVRIIGVGSPFGSDRIGWDGVAALAEQYSNQGLEFKILDRPGVNLLDYIQDVGAVILVDAIKAGLEPGKVVSFKEDEIKTDYQVHSTHGFGVAEVIALGRELEVLPKNIIFIGMEISNEPEWMPSSEQMKALKKLVTTEMFIFLNEATLSSRPVESST